MLMLNKGRADRAVVREPSILPVLATAIFRRSYRSHFAITSASGHAKGYFVFNILCGLGRAPPPVVKSSNLFLR